MISKNFIRIVIPAFLLFSIQVVAQEITKVDSKISEVTVFMSGAELHHQASVYVKEGKQELLFQNLSPDMDPKTIVVNIDPKDITILAVSNRTNYLNSEKDNNKIAIVKDSVAITSDRILGLLDKISVLEKERDLLFKNEAIGGTSNNVPIVEIEKAANFYRGRMNEINDQIFKLRKEHAEVRSKNESLKFQLVELNAQYNPPTSEITLVVMSNKAQKAEVSIKYQVINAGWEPKYDVRASGIFKPIELMYRANIYNNCGKDWNSVRLKLSTADPKQGAERPKLDEWDLAELQHRNVNSAVNGFFYNQELDASQGVGTGGGGAPGNGYADLKEVEVFDKQYDSKAESKRKNQIIAPVEEIVEVAELNAEFEIPQPYTILADSKPYIVDVANHIMDAKYEHYAVPKMDADAFLVAKVVGWHALNLVSGDASVYYNGAYLGNSYINTNTVDDTLTLSLGRDRKLNLARIKISEENKKQSMGNSTRETLVYKITAKNNRDGAVTLTIEDQLPISSDADIEISPIELSDAELDKDSGKLTWKLNLKPGESKDIILSYSVKSPKWLGVSTERVVRRSRAKF